MQRSTTVFKEQPFSLASRMWHGGETKSPQPLLQTSLFQQQHFPHPNQLYMTTRIVCYSSATSECKKTSLPIFPSPMKTEIHGLLAAKLTLLAMQLQDNLNRHSTQKYKLVLPLFLWHTGWPDTQESGGHLQIVHNSPSILKFLTSRMLERWAKRSSLHTAVLLYRACR